MQSLSIGPLALPLAPVLLGVGLALASWLATRLARRSHPEQAEAAGNLIFSAGLLGLLAARLGHLLLNAEPYLATPMDMLDVRDGGWLMPAGVAAGLPWLAWGAWQTPALRRALALATLTGLTLWGGATALLGAQSAPMLPALPLTDLASGSALTLRDAARGRPVVVNLWASWCGPCRQEMPMLAAAQQGETQIGILFVNQGEPPERVRAYLAAEGLALREVLLDPGSAAGPALGSRGLPTTLFYDAQGRLVDAHLGVLSSASLQARLRALRSPA